MSNVVALNREFTIGESKQRKDMNNGLGVKGVMNVRSFNGGINNTRESPISRN